MPNWCLNKLTIEGDEEELNKFYEENKSDENELSFEKGVPPPENLDELSDEEFKKLLINDNSLGSSPRWYEFNCSNWGTKWDTNDVNINQSDGELYYDFMTAWSPPQQWLKTISQKYLDLKFTLESEEPGCDFWCLLVIENGEIIEEEEEDLTTRNFKKLYEQYPMEEINIKFLELINQNLEIDDYEDCQEINEILEEYGICDHDEEWYLLTNHFEKMDYQLDKAKKVYENILLKKKIKKFMNFCQKQKLHENLIEFHTCPPLGDKILKNGGFLYQEAEKMFYEPLQVENVNL